MEYILRAACVAALFFVSGCATVIKGSDQSVTIITDPTGAVCELERDGTTIAVINPTPGTAEIDRDKDMVLVTCERESYETSVAQLSSEFTGYTFGNLLLGGFIGVAVDAASGANSQYPDSITVIMVPNEFDSEDHRDRTYDKLKRQLQEQSDSLAANKRDKCAKGAEKSCEEQAKAIEEARDEELEALEERRLRAVIKDTMSS